MSFAFEVVEDDDEAEAERLLFPAVFPPIVVITLYGIYNGGRSDLTLLNSMTYPLKTL